MTTTTAAVEHGKQALHHTTTIWTASCRGIYRNADEFHDARAFVLRDAKNDSRASANCTPPGRSRGNSAPIGGICCSFLSKTIYLGCPGGKSKSACFQAGNPMVVVGGNSTSVRKLGRSRYAVPRYDILACFVGRFRIIYDVFRLDFAEGGPTLRKRLISLRRFSEHEELEILAPGFFTKSQEHDFIVSRSVSTAAENMQHS